MVFIALGIISVVVAICLLYRWVYLLDKDVNDLTSNLAVRHGMLVGRVIELEDRLARLEALHQEQEE